MYIHNHKNTTAITGTGKQLKLCGMSKGLCRHKETWCWNEEVAEAVREKKIKYRKWKRGKSEGGMDGL